MKSRPLRAVGIAALVALCPFLNSLEAAELPPVPAAMGIPTAGPAAAPGSPYAPQALAPGGVVMTLFPPDSPYLKPDRIHEAETYGFYGGALPGYLVNIHNPSIEFHAGNGELNTGTAIILVAGGGHNKLNIFGEGSAMIPYFGSRGISTILLRNRLRSDGYDPKTDGVHDLQQAVKLVRAHAEQWNIDPNKIGVLGFSAGAELCAAASLYYDEFDAKNDMPENPLAKISSRPDFNGLVYPGPSPFFFAFEDQPSIPADSPPAFFTGPGWGDWIHALWATEYFTALLNDGVPNVELHIYARGVHPGDRGKPGQAPATGGITLRDGVGFGTWQERYMDWLDDLGFTGKPGEVTRAALDIAANLDRESPMDVLQERMAERRAAAAAEQKDK
ncbi:alpha/beta hydrolase [Synoicihabitans lomoniglobus]|uniref:Alpha/beta hydrolase n=1 Tax=Synoicihabitans lomoniglobus TaxID=2909285 RepID=A0AAF0CRZ3_9BACT|nr:alpha/beta hydrolase [Opitutaceae bacterium LMO-M01]WED66891.1 alpha/beta hydrolase [Opitutaceae bacterium LMO-M01]